MSKRRRRPWYKPRRSRRAQRWAFAVVAISLGGAAWAAHGAYTTMAGFPERPGHGNAEDVIALEVPRGASFPRVLDLLVEEGVPGPLHQRHRVRVRRGGLLEERRLIGSVRRKVVTCRPQATLEKELVHVMMEKFGVPKVMGVSTM